MTTLLARPERSPLARAAFAGACALVLLGTFGFLAVRARHRAAAVESALDARIAALRSEIAACEEARANHDAIRRQVADLTARLAAVTERFPCELDADAFLSDLRTALGPLGAEVRADLGWRQARGGVKELRVPVLLPAASGADDAAREALARLPRVVLLEPRGSSPSERVAVGVAQEHCPREPPPLPSHDAPIPGRDLVGWPFDGGVRERERLVRSLRSERDAASGPLKDLEWARLLERQLEFAESRLAAWR